MKYINDLLEDIKSKIPSKRKWWPGRARSEKEFMDLLDDTLKEVDSGLTKVSAEIKEELVHSRCPSSAVSDIDFPLPSKVTKVEAKPEGKYMVVSWQDNENSADNIKQYNNIIYIDDIVRDIYADSGSGANLTSNKYYSVRLGVVFDTWGRHYVQVSAVNKADQEGQKSSYVLILMNQCPPNIKPMGLKVLTVSSRTSLVLSVDYPENFDDMAISKCKIYGFADRTIPMTREASFLETRRPSDHTNTLQFEVTDIEPQWNCQATVFFCNDYGEGIRSDKIGFQINSLRPSKPTLSLIEKSNNSIKIEISTKTNPGNVLQYHLYRRQGYKGKKEKEPEPIKQRGSAPIIYDINDLQPSKKYHLYIVSESAIDKSTLESDILQVKTLSA